MAFGRTRREPVIASSVTPRRRSFLDRMMRPQEGTRRSPRSTGITGHKRRGFMGARRSDPIIGTTRNEPVIGTHHQRHRVTVGERLHGLGKKIKGALTGRPGKKAAGTRMMRGTDGIGARRTRRRFF